MSSKLFAVRASRFTWLGWLLLFCLFFGGGFCMGYAVALVNGNP